MVDYKKLLADRKYNADHAAETEQILLTIDDKTSGCLSSFVIYSGVPKSGKSTFIGATIGSAIKRDPVFSIALKPLPDRNRICLFDTESSQFDFYKQIDKIKFFGGVQQLPDHIDCFNCREDQPTTIQNLIETYLHYKPDCSVLIIDGLLDLLIDYNDVKESRMLINWIKKITKVYNILIIGVLHLGKKDLQTLGHFGSQSDRYAQSTLKIEKNKESNSYCLSAQFLRSSDDFTPIEIMWNNGWHQQSSGSNKKHTFKDWTDLEHKYKATQIIGGSGEDYKEIVDYLKEVESIGTNAAKSIVKMWISKKIIFKRDKKYIVL